MAKLSQKILYAAPSSWNLGNIDVQSVHFDPRDLDAGDVILPRGIEDDEESDRYQPMMCYLWPVFLGGRIDTQALADKLDDTSIVLINVSGLEIPGPCGGSYDYAFGMAGAGWDMSANLGLAYAMAGSALPTALASSALEMAFVSKPAAKRLIRSAALASAEHLLRRGKDLKAAVSRSRKA